ncbi:MAG TPA: ion transporter, partial [Planctomycetaceae bacterium]|nr:ion transporter [Planctomycetaceae bacterium]
MIFEADTRAGKVFDVGLLLVILISVAVVMLQSVNDFNDQWGGQLEAIEWVITGLFTLEYILRLLCVRKPRQYATSFFGVIDLLA